MSGIVNKIKDALHKDKDHSTTEHTTGHTTATGSGAPHGTGIAPDTHSTTHNTHGTGIGSNTHSTTHNTTGSGLTGTHGTHGTTTAGPHDSNLANKADPRVDSDRDGSRLAGTTGQSTHTGVGSSTTHHNTTNTAGPHSSNLANKADPRVDSDRDGSHHTSNTGHGTVGVGSDREHPGYYNIPHHGTTTDSSTGKVHSGNTTSNTFGGSSNPGVYGAGSNTIGSSNVPGSHSNTTSGPHSSNLANKADPRVDSDRDGSNLHGATGHSTTGTHGTSGTGYSSTGHSSGTGYSSTGHSSNTNTSTAGPHNSNVLNKLDPRVDSDRDGSKTAGNNNTSSTFGGNNTTSGHVSGPHQTDTANKLDPRIDSDRSNTNAGYGQTGTHLGNNSHGNTGYQSGVSHSTNAGPHDSNLANRADPRVDSDLDGKGNRHGANTSGGILGGTSGSHATPGSGTAQNTAGPHNSDLLNKLDPRVDSDRDHSKTVGGDKTHA